MPFQAAFQLEGRKDLRHGGGGHLASAYQFVNRSGYGAERLHHSGLALSVLGGKVTISLVSFGSEAAKYGLTPGDEITTVLVPAQRPSRYLFAIPALLLLGGVFVLQLRRRKLKLAVAAQ